MSPAAAVDAAGPPRVAVLPSTAMLRSLLGSSSLVLALAACGGKGTPATTTTGTGGGSAAVAPTDTRTELERRRDAACAALGPRITACADADSPADERSRPDHAAVLAKNTEVYVASCQAQQLSSRQVRVYEVCMREESECEPLLSCLDNARPQPAP